MAEQETKTLNKETEDQNKEAAAAETTEQEESPEAAAEKNQEDAPTAEEQEEGAAADADQEEEEATAEAVQDEAADEAVQEEPADEDEQEEAVAEKEQEEAASEEVQPAAADASGEEAPSTSMLEEAIATAVDEVNMPSAQEVGIRPADEEVEAVASVADPSALTHTAGDFGFTGEITGRVVKLEDLERDDESDEDATYREQLRDLVNESFPRTFSAQEIVTGRVATVSDKDVVIDIGFKSDGVVSRSEFDGEELNPGDEVEVYLERIEDYHGQLVLSKEKADEVRRWQRVEEAYENEEIIEGVITSRIKGGMLVDLFDGLEAFLPGSQIDVRRVRDFDAYLDRRMEFKIVKLNPANENIVISHRALIQKELDAQREKILSDMEAGQVLQGMVKNITDFGVFIDLGGVDGLLHITDLSWGRVSHPSELVDLDQELNVVVLDYDEERQRISLGLKQLQDHPWDDIEERFKEDEVHEGKVVSITNYGAFVELEKGIEGLVHISEMSWTDHIRHPSQMVSLGQLVEVKILNIDTEGKKISLGMKQLEPDPWEGLSDRYPPGTRMTGNVRNITNFGVFVEIEPGIDGLVHISDLSWTKKVRHPSELVSKGEEMDVVILNIDQDRRRISLGHKQINTNPWNDFAKVYAEDTDHSAKIARVIDSGLVVELPMEVQGFVPASELKNTSNHQEFYHEDDEIDLRVIRFDMQDKDIILSEQAKDRAEERDEEQAERQRKRAEERRRRDEVDDFSKKSASGPATLGELSGLANLQQDMDEAEAAAKPETVTDEDEPTPEQEETDIEEDVTDMEEVRDKADAAAEEDEALEEAEATADAEEAAEEVTEEESEEASTSEQEAVAEEIETEEMEAAAEEEAEAKQKSHRAEDEG